MADITKSVKETKKELPHPEKGWFRVVFKNGSTVEYDKSIPNGINKFIRSENKVKDTLFDVYKRKLEDPLTDQVKAVIDGDSKPEPKKEAKSDNG